MYVVYKVVYVGYVLEKKEERESMTRMMSSATL